MNNEDDKVLYEHLTELRARLEQGFFQLVGEADGRFSYLISLFESLNARLRANRFRSRKEYIQLFAESVQSGLRREIQISIRRLQEQMDRLSQRGKELLKRQSEGFNEESQEIQALSHFVEGLRDALVDMEIVSINTLTVAVRAGDAGEAFSYVTNEIKKLTQTMNQGADHLLAMTHSIRQEQEQSDGSLLTLEVFYERNKEFFTQILEKFRDDFFREIKDLEIFFRESFEGFEKVIQGLLQITTLLVRKQKDLSIFKNLAKMSSLLAVQYSSEEWSEGKQTAILDELGFAIQMLRYCSSQTLMLSQSLQQDAQFSLQNIVQLEQKIQQMNAQQYGFFLSEPVKNFSLNIKEILLSLKLDLQSLHTLTKGFLFQRQEHLLTLEKLRETFWNMGETVNRFYNVSVVSRIEIAKKIALETMKGNIREMRGLIEDIERQNKSGYDVTGQLYFRVEDLTSFLSFALLAEERVHSSLLFSIEDCSGEIERYYQRWLEFSQNYEIFSPELLDDMKLLKERMIASSGLSQALDTLASSVQDEEKYLLQIWANCLTRFDKKYWDIQHPFLRKRLSQLQLPVDHLDHLLRGEKLSHHTSSDDTEKMSKVLEKEAL